MCVPFNTILWPSELDKCRATAGGIKANKSGPTENRLTSNFFFKFFLIFWDATAWRDLSINPSRPLVLEIGKLERWIYI